MKFRNTLPHLMAILFLIVALASCQEDFSTLGSDIIGGQPINTLSNNSSTVIAYSRGLESVQTNSLPLYQLGSYNDPVYGKTKMELVSQLTLQNIGPDFGYGTYLDSVVLYIPYFSESVIEDDETTYTIDSVFGTEPINLSIYESNYFLRDYDPDSGLQERQKYYSNLGTVFEIPSNVGSLIYEEEGFVPSNEGYVLLTPDGDDDGDEPDETLVAPGLRFNLPVPFFRDKIISEEGSSKLMNNNNFKEYFRGLYFKVDDLGNDGNGFLFDIEDANITLYYTYQDTPVSGTISDTLAGADVERLSGELILNFAGINVNMFDNQLTPSIEESLNNPPNELEGEESLYVRGGNGIVTLINLFGDDEDDNGIADELDMIRQNEWLINEANLIFYVDQDKVTGGESEPERLIIYDAENISVLADYGRDATISAEPADAVTNHLGKLERGSDDNGDYYKIRITHHISNLVHKDSVNVPLALIATLNVLTGGFQSLENELESGLDFTPAASVIGHEGTVLYGNNTANEEKKLRLQIYYTEPN
jgi:hypothetical protein